MKEQQMADMSELTPDEVAVINARRAELAQQAEQQVHEGVAEPSYDPNSLGPREAMEQLWKETSQGGLRQEEVQGLAIARLAQGALRGDSRYLTTPQRFVQVDVGSDAQ
jgi:hypothetical protein